MPWPATSTASTPCRANGWATRCSASSPPPTRLRRSRPCGSPARWPGSCPARATGSWRLSCMSRGRRASPSTPCDAWQPWAARGPAGGLAAVASSRPGAWNASWTAWLPSAPRASSATAWAPRRPWRVLALRAALSNATLDPEAAALAQDGAVRRFPLAAADLAPPLRSRPGPAPQGPGARLDRLRLRPPARGAPRPSLRAAPENSATASVSLRRPPGLYPADALPPGILLPALFRAAQSYFRMPPMFRLFENLVDPFAPHAPVNEPPRRLWPWLQSFMGPFRGVFWATGIAVAGIAAVELWLIAYSGRLIDTLTAVGPRHGAARARDRAPARWRPSCCWSGR